MKNNVFRKGLVLAIIVLFVGAGVIPSISGNILGSLKTIYVDDDNTGGPWDGTQANPYQYIQDGIDASSNDDTVFVYGGTYNENVVVDKSIDLEGENKQTTIIDGGGSGDVVQIAVDGVSISGFKIQNSGDHLDAGILILSNYNTISDNIITNNNDHGIFLYYASSNTISNCGISNIYYGIILDYSGNNIFSKGLTS